MVALAVLAVASLPAYSFELAVGEGVAAAGSVGLAPDARTEFFPRGVFLAQLGFPLSVGKLHVVADGTIGPEIGLVAGAGWGGEWFMVPWFSLEAAVVAKGGWVMTWFSREPTQFVYAGLEPLFRANLLLLDGLLVLGVTSSPSVRWLQETLVVASLPAAATVGLRF